MNNKTSKVIIADNLKCILLLENIWSEWELPGGHVNKKESYINCAKRETFEETKIRLVNIERVKILDKCTIFYSSVRKKLNVRLSSEHTSFRWVEFKDINSMKIQ